MGTVIDTVLADVHNAATSAVGLTAATAATGDSFGVRSFASTDWARLEALFLQGSGTRQARIQSPRMHDNVTGITLQSAEAPTEFPLPQEVGEPLYSADVLSVSMDAAASSDTVMALLVYYKNIQGSGADVRMWADIASRIEHIKIAQVACITSATIGAWSDTVITTTENQYKADHAYAVLGFLSNVALCCMGLKGPATGNYRICAPGQTSTLEISRYFVEMSNFHQTPHIPVFKANDRASTYVSTAANTASVAANVYMVLADLGLVQ